MRHKLIQAFDLQARHCADLGSPFMERMCALFAKCLTPDGEVARTLFNWQGDVAAGGHNLPLRLMGALHHLALQKKCAPLIEVYPPHYQNKTDVQLWEAVQAAFAQHTSAILHQLNSPPQTNEVRRAGILLPGLLTIAEHVNGLPFVLSEVGASAGLNMNWDYYHYKLGDREWGEPSMVNLAPKWSGPVPNIRTIYVQNKRGCDLIPTDIGNEDNITNLLSYLWADQPERIIRTRAAFELAKKHPYSVDKMDAIDWLETRLEKPYEGAVHVIYHTIAWQYFPDKLKRKGRALLGAAGARTSTNAPLAWLGFEADGREPGGALALTMWPGGKRQVLARADYHGRWVNWNS